MDSAGFYDHLSSLYDRFVDWPARLSYELPFLEGQLREEGARRVVEAACGTGHHAIALARAGYEVVGTDLSEGMIARAREEARRAGVQAAFYVAGFGHISQVIATPADALLCLGNSLPHALDAGSLAETLSDFRAALRPGGLLLIQQRNFDRLQRTQERFMPLQSSREGEQEWLFFRFYDFLEDGLIRFHMIVFQRDENGGWTTQREETFLRSYSAGELVWALERAGFEDIALFGSMAGAPFDAFTSDDCILIAHSAR